MTQIKNKLTLNLLLVFSIFVLIVACLLALAANSQGDSWLVSVSFLVGAFA